MVFFPDATASEIDPFYVIAKTTELALSATAPLGSAEAMAEWRSRAAYWGGVADQRARAFPPLVNYRQVN